ncbi:hypothetical protein [Tenacibaculum sp. 190524A02b]|uniref:hypothetical protein n=1 Tax=Tenacibaculum vairaonense TaxID=3137860 RepID=UPI0031FB5DF7
MTAQLSDSFVFKGESYSLTGFTEGIDFHPENYNISIKSASSACWRGFVREFSIENDELLIKNFNVNDAGVTANFLQPIINGIVPKRNKGKFNFFNKSYENIDLKINYTGAILIGKGFISELYVHMGFHPAWKYETVYELTFEKGNLIAYIDLSEKLKEVRKEYKTQKKKTEESDISEWIKETFNQKYTKG